MTLDAVYVNLEKSEYSNSIAYEGQYTSAILKELKARNKTIETIENFTKENVIQAIASKYFTINNNTLMPIKLRQDLREKNLEQVVEININYTIMVLDYYNGIRSETNDLSNKKSNLLLLSIILQIISALSSLAGYLLLSFSRSNGIDRI